MASDSHDKARRHWARVARSVLAASRRDADVTQEQLAKRVGWTVDNVSDMERGRKKLEFADFVLLAKALRVPPETMFRRVMTWDAE